MEFSDLVKRVSISMEGASSEQESEHRMLTEAIRGNFMAFCDEIMSMYGSGDDDERLESLSSSSKPEIEAEQQKVAYRIVWLEALLNESRLELDLINTVLDSIGTRSDL